MKRKHPVSPKIQAAMPFLKRHRDFLVFGLDDNEELHCYSTRTGQDRLILLFESATSGKCQLFTPGYETPQDVALRLLQVVDQLRRVAVQKEAEAREIPFRVLGDPLTEAPDPSNGGAPN